MAERGAQFKSEYSVDELVAAIVTTAKAIDADYDEDKLRATLTALSDAFESSGAEYRTTTRSPRTINTRYFNVFVPHDPFKMVIDRGLLEPEDHPCMQIFPYFVENFQQVDNFTGFGVDVGATYGVEKIWAMIGPSVSLSRILEIPGLPDSLHNHEAFLLEHGLETIRVLGVDFRAKSVNLYFLPGENGGFDAERIKGLIEDPGFTLPDEGFVDANRTICIYYTFTYDADEIQRISFVSHDPDSSKIPIFDPVMETFINNAVTAKDVDEREFVFNPTISRKGLYSKVEIAFNQPGVDFFKALAVDTVMDQATKKNNQ